MGKVVGMNWSFRIKTMEETPETATIECGLCGVTYRFAIDSGQRLGETIRILADHTQVCDAAKPTVLGD